jgi:ribosomal protein L11 methyltransferase
VVPGEEAEVARATMIELFPEGFEERELAAGVELAAYTDGDGHERMRRAFAAVDAEEVEPGWEERWRAFHRPVRIGGLWIGPPWESPPPNAVAIVVDPGQAFGTGAHATTQLCLELLQESPRGSLLDVGCGSGVLAIAAAKLGFGRIEAIDIDPIAVEATRQNACANGVEIAARTADAGAAALPATQLAIANLSHAAVGAIGARFAAEQLVVSGYLDSDEPPRLASYRQSARRTREGWAADAFVRRSASK